MALLVEYSAADDEHLAHCKHALSQAERAVGQRSDRAGVVCYAFARDETSGLLYFTEIYSDEDCFMDHLSAEEGSSLAPLFSKDKKIKRSVAAVNVNTEHDGVMAALGMVGGLNVRHLSLMNGSLLRPSAETLATTAWHAQASAASLPAVLVELLVDSPVKEEGEEYMNFLENAVKVSSPLCLSAFVTREWRPRRKNFSAAFLLFSSAKDACEHFSAQLMSGASGSFTLTATAETLKRADTGELTKRISSSGKWTKSADRVLFAGFLIHPSLIPSSGVQPPAPPKAPTSTSSHATTSQPTSDEEPLFIIQKHPVTKKAENIIFSKNAAGRSAHKLGSRKPTSTSSAKESGKQLPAVVEVPLLHLLRKLTRLGHLDVELPVVLVYGQLARLRALQRDADEFNASSDEEISADAELKDRVARLLESVSNLGYAMPSTHRALLQFQQLRHLIGLIEEFFPSTFDADSGTVEYMSLQDVYPIGSIVISENVGVGGTPVAFKVIDCFYDPMRSLFGGRKFQFNLVLECFVLIGGQFVCNSFTVLVEEFMGEHSVAGGDLQFRPVPRDDPLLLSLRRRGEILNKLAGAPVYIGYRSNCFFPGGGGGAANARSKQSVNQSRLAAPGLAVIDSQLGLSLHVSPSASSDELGLSISATVKALKSAMRESTRDGGSSSSSNVSEETRRERLRQAGIRLVDKLPEQSLQAAFAFPLVVAFSLSIKRWGRVLVDQLVPLKQSADAWNQLVLPVETKESLIAMATMSLKGISGKCKLIDLDSERQQEQEKDKPPIDPEVEIVKRQLRTPPRFVYSDIVSGKGTGVLFLLFGPPGTGKTLSVEALAQLLGRPLYSISFAELGSTVSDLEERLESVLNVAAKWGALVLLDEGDALVEKREKGQFQMNSMTGMLLRVLENFEGSLFVTSNRARAFDPAALSRVTLAIKYKEISLEGKEKIWLDSLARVTGKSRAHVKKRFDLARLAHFSGSGRAVGAIIRLSIGLAERRELKEIDMSTLPDALRVWSQFNSDLDDEGVAKTWGENVEKQSAPSLIEESSIKNQKKKKKKKK